jgi:hypothetical protein
MGMAAAIIAASVSSARRRIAASFEDRSPRSHSGVRDSTSTAMRVTSSFVMSVRSETIGKPHKDARGADTLHSPGIRFLR